MSSITTPLLAGSAQARVDNYTLVVIDMQPDFPFSLDPNTLAAVEQEILEAKNLNAGIVFVEYYRRCTFGPTNHKLTRLTRCYVPSYTVYKTDIDGSNEVVYACRLNGFTTTRLRVCGVNTHVCVQQTVCGLAKKLSNSIIEVVKAACNGPYTDWSEFPSRPNIVLEDIRRKVA